MSDNWDDYSSEQMFPGCNCGHDATMHTGMFHDWREGHGCLEDQCPCDIVWEHT